MKKNNSESSKILKIAEKEMISCKHPYVGTEHLLLSLLKNKNISSLCSKYNLYYDNYKKELLNIIGMCSKESKYILYTPLLRLVINKAKEDSVSDNKELNEYYLFNSLLSYKDGIGYHILNRMDIDLNNLIKDVTKSNSKFLYGKCLNDISSESVFLRDREINELMQILLRKNKNNPLLVGKAGVGKTAIVNELVNRIKAGNVPDDLKDKKIFSVSMSSLIAGTKYRGDFEEKVHELINYCKNDSNIILFIDEIHTIMKTGSSEGAIDAANILKPYLTNGDLKIIGATTLSEYNEYIKKDKAFLRRFTTIKVSEPSINDTIFILNKIKCDYEKYYNLKINKNIIKEIVDITSDYMPNLNNPDKSIEFLDSVCSRKKINNYNSNNKNNIVCLKDVNDLVKDRFAINCFDNEQIIKIKEELKNEYNSEIVNNIINIIRDNKLNKYMYLNGKNINKIKLLKSIGNKLDVDLIEIDCLDYKDEYSINKLIGNDYIFNLIDENPNSFFIINNFDKSSKILHNIIDNIINTGYIINNNNEKVFLNNSILFICNNSDESFIGFNNEALA